MEVSADYDQRVLMAREERSQENVLAPIKTGREKDPVWILEQAEIVLADAKGKVEYYEDKVSKAAAIVEETKKLLPEPPKPPAKKRGRPKSQ
jgi:hypothetical protein